MHMGQLGISHIYIYEAMNCSHKMLRDKYNQILLYIDSLFSERYEVLVLPILWDSLFSERNEDLVLSILLF